eukprot:10214763-Lingulodinium_polyedra.AAC.1
MVVPRAGGMEPAFPLVVEPPSQAGAVEIGWPGHFAVLLFEAIVPLPEVCTCNHVLFHWSQ